MEDTKGLFVITLTRILFDGVNAFINQKKAFSPSKGNEEIVNQTKVNEGRITALGTQMVSIAQPTLKEIYRLQKDIVDNNKKF